MSDKWPNDKIFYTYARADGEDLGEWMFGSDSDESGAKGLAEEYAEGLLDEGTDALPVMVVYEMRPIAIGTPKIEPGEVLDDDGDKEPDSFVGYEWKGRGTTE